MSKATVFHPRLAAMTDDLDGPVRLPRAVGRHGHAGRVARVPRGRGADGLLDAPQGRDRGSGRARVHQHAGHTRRLGSRAGPHRVRRAVRTTTARCSTTARCWRARPIGVRFCGANDRDYELFRDAAPDGVTVREVTDAYPHLCLQGPRSREILQSLTDDDLSNAAFPYYRFREDDRDRGHPRLHDAARVHGRARLRALDRGGARARGLGRACWRPAVGFGMAVIGMEALDLFRIEGGFIIGGVEYDPTVSPYECGLGWSVDLDKGDVPRSRRVRARSRRHAAALDERRTRRRRRRRDSGARSRSTASRSGSSHRPSRRRTSHGRTLGLAKIDRDHNVEGQTRHRARRRPRRATERSCSTPSTRRSAARPS